MNDPVTMMRTQAEQYAELSDWASIEQDGSNEVIHHLVKVGNSVLVSVETAPNPPVLVHIGLGVYVSKTMEETKKFADHEMERLFRASDVLTQEHAQLRASYRAIELSQAAKS